MTNRTALITGASGGIGLELARLLASDGNNLVLVARSAERLNQIALELREGYGISVRTHPHDMSDRDAADLLWRELTDAGIGIDVLINNAGVGLHGSFATHDVAVLQRLVTLNVTTLTMLTRLALPPMLARRRGRILNVASLAAYQPGGPGEAVYYATKSFVLSFSKGLSRELQGTGVSVTALCPGPTRTLFDERAGSSETFLFKSGPVMSPGSVARAGYRGMMRGSRVVIPGLLAKLAAFAGELPPRRIALEVNRWLLR